MSSSNGDVSLAPELRRQLLDVANDAIRTGVRGARLHLHAEDYPAPLREQRASFVTLHVGHRLRGCVGTLEPHCSLVEGVARNAYAAAFEDPRFPPLTAAELPGIDVHLSILTTPQPMSFASEADLVAQLRPYEDGLVLQEGRWRGTFLPSVWEQVPDPHHFLRELKIKAGLPPGYWSPTLTVQRYRTESIP